MKTIKILFLLFAVGLNAQAQPPCVHPASDASAQSDDGAIKIKHIGQWQNYKDGPVETRDEDINSPKSVHIHPNGKKYYVNSLEGCATVVYDMATNRKIKVIHHDLNSSTDNLWGTPSNLYPFTHYEKDNHFQGKPVESTFSHNGRYLWVPYYRRTYDINAQDPSALAVIDTRTDEIVRMMETGPLPKMIATSNNGKEIAVSHWGNNTVGIIDISSDNPMDWHHKALLVVDYVLPLNFPLDVSVDRDNGSGYALRGTVFTPDDKYLLVGCMGSTGGIAVINVETHEYLGRVLGMKSNVRHLVIKNGWLYLSINASGYVQRIKLDKFLEAAKSIKDKKTCKVKGWQSCKVCKGARTIEISPSGNYVFAACNFDSKLCVVDTRKMKMVASIPVDSYPVGLDLSEDGRFAFVTSQGRKDKGGNAVNIYEIEYAEPEPVPATHPDEGDTSSSGSSPQSTPQCGLNQDATTTAENATSQSANSFGADGSGQTWLAYGAAGIVACGLLGLGIYKYKK